MSSFVAIYDACVLYPAPLRDLLMRVALTGLFRARWTSRIHDEWINAVLQNRKDLLPAQLHRTRELMNSAVPDCLVTEYEALELELELPDRNDRHVLAAAIRSHAGVIVTYNLKDFPADVLGRFGIEAQHPDEFIGHLMDLDRAAVCASVRRQRAGLKNPTVTPEQLLERYLSMGLAGTVAALESMIDLI